VVTKSEYGWWAALGASAILHGGAAALVMIQLAQLSALKIGTVEVPDIWNGSTIAIDTEAMNPLGSSEPSVASAVQVEASSAQERPAATEIPNPARAQTSSSPTEHGVLPGKRRPAPQPEMDPEEALRQRIMGFRPTPATQNQAVEGSDVEPASSPAGAGSSELAAGVRNLAKAFTRALPNAASADRSWQSSPLGKLEKGMVTLRVDDAGAITDTEFNREASQHFRDLVKRTVLSLGAGQFALHAASLSAGMQRLEIEIVLSQLSAGTAGGDSGRIAAIGFEAPSPGIPGKGYFTLASGWHFEAGVRIAETRSTGSARP
jgi:hypothetical protein